MPYAAPRLNLQVDAGFTFKKAVFMHCPSAQSTAAAAAAAAEAAAAAAAEAAEQTHAAAAAIFRVEGVRGRP